MYFSNNHEYMYSCDIYYIHCNHVMKINYDTCLKSLRQLVCDVPNLRYCSDLIIIIVKILILVTYIYHHIIIHKILIQVKHTSLLLTSPAHL